MGKQTAAAGIKKYIKFAGNAVCGFSVLFLMIALMRTEFDFSQVTNWRLFLFVFAVATVFKTATVFMSASAWCFWLEFFAKRRCDRKMALRVYAKANIGKYLPGNVMHYVERNLFAGKLHLSQKQIAAASVCEIVSLVLTALFMGTFLAFSGMRKVLLTVGEKVPVFHRLGHTLEEIVSGSVFTGWKVWLSFAAVILAVLASVFFCRYRKGSAKQRQIMNKKFCAADFFAWIIQFLRSFFIYAAVLLILGLTLVLLYWYLGGRPAVRQALEMTAAYIIAWVLGFIIPGAPGGIGVREMALTLLLTPVTGKDSIVVLSVLHRLVTVAGDFAAYLATISKS